ncbi:hypothetical protein STRTUCAR8_00661 [Streptomyces turgidiscabies Car8]|uniref:Uncharacterized protein n=1 Tax=Streptomyces turgidiscabies (strain Car8) TaxID=698760 RepID=L7EW38_STRT8|nr:hypothetical protein STRTUCAR8_00661 [Streptomyces turgidiscabies Car8]
MYAPSRAPVLFNLSSLTRPSVSDRRISSSQYHLTSGDVFLPYPRCRCLPPPAARPARPVLAALPLLCLPRASCGMRLRP